MFIAIFIYLITIFIIYCISMSSSNSANAGTSASGRSEQILARQAFFFIFSSFFLLPFERAED